VIVPLSACGPSRKAERLPSELAAVSDLADEPLEVVSPAVPAELPPDPALLGLGGAGLLLLRGAGGGEGEEVVGDGGALGEEGAGEGAKPEGAPGIEVGIPGAGAGF
jgi:hypothetical protein